MIGIVNGQNMPVEIGLIELTEPSGALNYKPFLKHCILETILHVFLLFIFMWNKLHFFDLVWIGIRFYSIKGFFL